MGISKRKETPLIGHLLQLFGKTMQFLLPSMHYRLDTDFLKHGSFHNFSSRLLLMDYLTTKIVNFQKDESGGKNQTISISFFPEFFVSNKDTFILKSVTSDY